MGKGNRPQQRQFGNSSANPGLPTRQPTLPQVSSRPRSVAENFRSQSSAIAIGLTGQMIFNA
jgi:hypothetical protein